MACDVDMQGCTFDWAGFLYQVFDILLLAAANSVLLLFRVVIY